MTWTLLPTMLSLNEPGQSFPASPQGLRPHTLGLAWAGWHKATRSGQPDQPAAKPQRKTCTLADRATGPWCCGQHAEPRPSPRPTPTCRPHAQARLGAELTLYCSSADAVPVVGSTDRDRDGTGGPGPAPQPGEQQAAEAHHRPRLHSRPLLWVGESRCDLQKLDLGLSLLHTLLVGLGVGPSGQREEEGDR